MKHKLSLSCSEQPAIGPYPLPEFLYLSNPV